MLVPALLGWSSFDSLMGGVAIQGVFDQNRTVVVVLTVGYERLSRIIFLIACTARTDGIQSLRRWLLLPSFYILVKFASFYRIGFQM